MTNPLDLLIITLATFAVSYMATNTSGPFAIFSRLRDVPFLRDLLRCFYCAAPWVALILWVIQAFEVGKGIALVFAACGGAYFLFRRGNG